MVDLPTSNTRPLGNSAGAVDPRSASTALSWYQRVGAKPSSNPMVGLSLRTLSLLSYWSVEL